MKNAISLRRPALRFPVVAKRLADVRVDLEARGGEKPSDHAPVIATFR